MVSSMVENQHLKLGLFFIHSDMQNNDIFIFNCLKKKLVSPSPFTLAVFKLDKNIFFFYKQQRKITLLDSAI